MILAHFTAPAILFLNAKIPDFKDPFFKIRPPAPLIAAIRFKISAFEVGTKSAIPTAGLNESLCGMVWDTIFEETKNAILICITHDEDILNRFNKIVKISESILTRPVVQ